MAGRVGEQPLQGGVLPLQLLQSLGVVSFEPAELIPPPIVGPLQHLQPTADIRDLLTLGQHPIGLGQFANKLLRVCLSS